MKTKYLVVLMLAASTMSSVALVKAAVEPAQLELALPLRQTLDLLPILSMVVVGAVARIRKKIRAQIHSN